jgi:hypothetical protein
MISTSIWINECLVTGNNYVINGVIIKKEDKRDTQSIGFDRTLGTMLRKISLQRGNFILVS